MVLSDREILEIQSSDKPMISPFEDSRLRSASYDVTLGDEITVLLERSDVLDLSDQDAVDGVYSSSRGLNGFVLKPGQYCLAALNEVIMLPDNVVARVMPRTRFTRLGLMVSAQFCNPSYSGRLQIGIFNASGNNIKLVHDMGIAQLVFERLESTPTEGRLYRNQLSAAYQDEDGFIGAQTKTEMSEDARRIYDRLMADLKEGI